MADIYTFVNYLVNTGVIELFVPFILIFSLVYAAFLMSGIFKDKVAKNLQVIISVAISFLAISPHFIAPGSRYDIVAVMLEVLPSVGLLFVAVIAILMLIGMTGFKAGEDLASWFTVGAVIFIIYLFLISADILDPISFLSNDIISAIIALVIFFLVVAYITGGSGGDENKVWWRKYRLVERP